MNYIIVLYKKGILRKFEKNSNLLAIELNLYLISSRNGFWLTTHIDDEKATLVFADVLVENDFRDEASYRIGSIFYPKNPKWTINYVNISYNISSKWARVELNSADWVTRAHLGSITIKMAKNFENYMVNSGNSLKIFYREGLMIINKLLEYMSSVQNYKFEIIFLDYRGNDKYGVFVIKDSANYSLCFNNPRTKKTLNISSYGLTKSFKNKVQMIQSGF
jgi:hypothetical protein